MTVLLFYSKKIESVKFNQQKELSYVRTLPEPHTKSGKRLGVQRDQFGKFRMVSMRDWWAEYGLNEEVDITPLYRNNSERTGYPTQKPLKLYERIIKASSDENDIVLDPFAGCATTLVAAERLSRQWVGIDIWNNAEEVVLNRLEKEGLTAPKYSRRNERNRQKFLFSEDMHFTSELPERTDDGGETVPFLRSKIKTQEPPGMRMSRDELKSELLKKFGSFCLGCGREFDDERYLEIDHNNPRSLGGLNYISNRILLCAPCNKIKSNDKTLAGLWKVNREEGYMVNDEVTRIKFG